MLRLNKIIETALYVENLAKARDFYSDTLELEVMFESPTLVAFNVGGVSTQPRPRENNLPASP